MRKILFVFGLLLMQPVCAAFYESGRADVGTPGEYTNYLDLDSTFQTSDGRATWLITDYKLPQPFADGIPAHRSVVSLVEYDCASERRRFQSLNLYAGKLGKGELVYSMNLKSAWYYERQGSIGWQNMKRTCGQVIKR